MFCGDFGGAHGESEQFAYVRETRVPAAICRA
jgi:hypothetical protein